MREIRWRLTVDTEERFQQLWELLEHYEEGSDDWWAISEEIGRLPGHPARTTKDDFIRREIIK